MKKRSESYDLVVCGGGLAGFCAAIAASRHGLKICLVHERPVLGGVASSEMRVTVHGSACHHAYARETGIIGEALTDERARNHEWINENGWTNSVFDQVLYDMAVREPNLTLHLNTPVVDVIMENGTTPEIEPGTTAGYYERPACAASHRISAVVARTLSAEVELTLFAPLFVDATGDAFVADRAGCGWRMGTEGREETGEAHAPAKASTDTMGNSIHIRCRNIGREAPYSPPPWAVQHEDARYFYEQGRPPSDPKGGYWWFEIGVPWHTIHDNEEIRHQLTRHALGVWDWMKNRDPKTMDACRNYALDFIGQVPGKRESRRVYGRHWLNANELMDCVVFPDEVAYGGWFIDLHTAGGLLAATSEPSNAEGYVPDSDYAAKSYVGPYGIPLRSLIARDVDNLFMAGRCISTTHAALGSARVMGTTSLMGQAVGTAAAVMRQHDMDLPGLAADAETGGPIVHQLQQTLLRDGCFLPNVKNQDKADLARTAQASASSSAMVHGQSPADAEHRNGQGWRPRGRSFSLEKVQGQVLHLSGGDVDRLEICCDNSNGTTVRLPVRLVRLEQIWDYRVGGSCVVAESSVEIPPGNDQWAVWNANIKALPAGTYRLECGRAQGMQWLHLLALQQGYTAQFQITPVRMRDHHCGLAFRISPAQSPYPASNALSGVARPQHGTNLWRSDPGAGLPAWFQLDWKSEQIITSVELTFASHLLAEIHSEPPFWRDPQIARDYTLSVGRDGTLHKLLRVTGNYHRRRVHQLPQGHSVGTLRLTILATNGNPAAGLYEIRCY
ncbi:MAG: FAD-dependent oxidoreductase [Chthoniobacteraceae bacterium]